MSDNKDYFIKGQMYQYDLGWLIEKLLSFETDLATAIDLKTIKYADPIQWDITTQYPPNTVVINPKNGTAYMSKVPVPAGINLDNTNYWVVVFNYQDIYYKIMDGVAFNDRNEDYATKELLVNDLVWYAGELYRVIKAIPEGAKYVPGTNLTKTTIEDLLESYYGRDRTAQVNNDTVNVSGDYTLNAGDIAETSDNRTIKVTHDREIDVDGSDSVHVDGASTLNVGGLRTETFAGNKTETVTGTIIENFGNANTTVTGKWMVNTPTKSFSMADVALNSDVENIKTRLDNSRFKTVFDYGAKGDGVHDDTIAFQTAIDDCIANGYSLYIPKSSTAIDSDGYILSATLNINYPLTIIADPLSVLNWKNAHENTDAGYNAGLNNSRRFKGGVGINIDYGTYGGHKGFYRFGILQGDKSFIKQGASLPTGHYWIGIKIASADLVTFQAEYISYWLTGLQLEATDTGGVENAIISFKVADDNETGIIFTNNSAYGIYTTRIDFNTIGQGCYGISFDGTGVIDNIVINGEQILVEAPNCSNFGTWNGATLKKSSITVNDAFNGKTPNTLARHGSSANFNGDIFSGNNGFNAQSCTFNIGYWDPTQYDVKGSAININGKENVINNVHHLTTQTQQTGIISSDAILPDAVAYYLPYNNFKLNVKLNTDLAPGGTISVWCYNRNLLLDSVPITFVNNINLNASCENWYTTTPHLLKIIVVNISENTINAGTELSFFVRI